MLVFAFDRDNAKEDSLLLCKAKFIICLTSEFFFLSAYNESNLLSYFLALLDEWVGGAFIYFTNFYGRLTLQEVLSLALGNITNLNIEIATLCVILTLSLVYLGIVNRY